MGTDMADLPVGEMRPGDHAAFPFATAEEQAQVIGPFLRDGLAARQKVVYLGDGHPRRLPGLAGRPDADHYVATGRLQVVPRAEACLTAGRFDPDRLLTVIGGQIVAAADEGYPAVRVTGDMSWVLGQPDGYPRRRRRTSRRTRHSRPAGRRAPDAVRRADRPAESTGRGKCSHGRCGTSAADRVR